MTPRRPRSWSVPTATWRSRFRRSCWWRRSAASAARTGRAEVAAGKLPVVGELGARTSVRPQRTANRRAEALTSGNGATSRERGASLATVLLVDDEPDLRQALSEPLCDEGYEVATAANGAVALDHLRSHPAP